LKITPDVILGDMDSISDASRKFFRSVKKVPIAEQNSTDLEKALRYCLRHRITSVDIVGATGDRIDHSTCALGCFREFGHLLQMRIVDPLGEMYYVGRRFVISTRKGQKISLIPLNRCMGIYTQNLRYGLRGSTLELGCRNGISNEATGDEVAISVRRGSLILLRYY
jgi:thiamine pyrophosphokinase